MRRAAVLVDVHAVRIAVDEVRLQVQAVKEHRRRGRGRAVGAVDKHAHAREVAVHARKQVLDIELLHLAHAVEAAADLAAGLVGHGRARKNQLLDPLLHLVRQLIAAAVENFDTVVLIRIVRGRDDDARVRLFQNGQIRDGRGRDRPERHHVAARGADTGHQRRLEHIGGNTRVLTDGDRQSVLFLLRQNRRQRAANLKGEVDRQIFADDAADSVRSKQFTHKKLSSYIPISNSIAFQSVKSLFFTAITNPTAAVPASPCADGGTPSASRSARAGYASESRAASDTAHRHPRV